MIATCRHCKAMIVGPDTGMIVNGEPSREYMRFIEKLAKHVKSEHPGQEGNTAAVLELAGHLAGLSILGNFETADPELRTYRDGVAALLHRVAGRTVPDEALRARAFEKVSALVEQMRETEVRPEDMEDPIPAEEVAARITDLLCDLRDALTYADVPVSVIVKPVDATSV